MSSSPAWRACSAPVLPSSRACASRAVCHRMRLVEGAERTMRIALTRETDRLEQHLSYLATVGSTSPYIGLFGTVWGIMTSFHALASVSQATIAMVAPGISEALIATAMGLFAAIPAVIGYNKYSNQVDRLEVRLDNFKDEFSSILQPPGAGCGRRLRSPWRRRNRRRPMAEINVVPYIDVMLVLLIIFMVTAPLLNLGVEVNLPEADAAPLENQENNEPMVVTVLKNGDLYLERRWRR